MQATIWTLLPPMIAIILALATKEVYVSLIIGILSGALLLVNGNPITAVDTTFSVMGDKMSGNADILIFLVLLGILVALISKSGASLAYGNWASGVIKTKRGALLATTALGSLIFVDDYFNCLTVGTVMRPVTDKHKITRAKLAYIIDSTAAPVCIIAPVSSWAAAVATSLPENMKDQGFSIFLQTIPFNFYALFTLVFMLFIIISGIDLFKMKKVEEAGLDTSSEADSEEFEIVGTGRVIDLVLPILFLILSAVGFMLYTGGYFSGQGISIRDAFADTSAGRSLVLSSFFTLVFTFLLYLPRKIINFNQFCSSIVEGFKAMTPSITILCLAWTLSGICSEEYLNLQGFVASHMNPENIAGVAMFLPAIFFVISIGLAFSTGTSWGTFAILIPIAASVFPGHNMLVVSVAAILAGAVCGDHISPISDTTILASAGAQCNHIDHVNTQLPYALSVAVCCIIGFLAAGITQNGYYGLIAGSIALVAMLVTYYMIYRDKETV
ncbi:MAG: Na+/H+ antiporter NhaC family protein [bacterium]|nr:Na+/H+ antiporter NhaC family protein [bacterium]